MNSKKLCIYHKNCLDGFASAYIVRSFFGASSVEFMALDYHDPIPDFTGRDVYLVDFSFTPEVMLPEIAKANSVVMLDHHDGARKTWGLNWDTPGPGSEFKNFVAIIETSKSGVGVVWDFFYNNQCSTHSPMPELFKYVQDYDLYNLRFEHTRAIQAALTSTDMIRTQNFDRFCELFSMFEDGGTKDLIEHGYIVLEAQRAWCRDIVDRVRGTVLMAGYTVPIANVPHELRDIAGELLYPGVPFSVTYEDRIDEGVRKVSLRSDRETGINVIDVAKTMGGGGGHPHASGFTLPLPKKKAPNEATLAELVDF